MVAIEKGKQIIITKGKNSGKKAEIVEILDENILQVKLSNDKLEKISIRHVEPLK